MIMRRIHPRGAQRIDGFSGQFTDVIYLAAEGLQALIFRITAVRL